MKLKIKQGVCFEIYGERTYLRDISQRKDYWMNQTAGGLLSVIRNGATDLPSIIHMLEEKYSFDSFEEASQSIASFIEVLLEDGLLIDLDQSTEPGNEYDAEKQFQQYCMENMILSTISFQMTYRCNERCVHCYVDRNCSQSNELTYADYCRILDEAKELGCMSVLLTGGEVCMKECFVDVAEYAAAKGMLVDIYSNGLDISTAMFDRIVRLKPNSVSFSLYGGTPEVHDAITQIPGSFEKTLKSVMMIKCAGIDTFIKTVAMRENLDDLEALFQLGKRIGVQVCTAYELLNKHNGESNDCRRLKSAKEMLQILRIASTYEPETERLVSSYERTRVGVCGAGVCSLDVDPYGVVRPCLSVDLPLGNIQVNSLREIWESSETLQHIRGLKYDDLCPKIKECPSADICIICMGSCGVPDRTYHGIMPDTCHLAEARHIIEKTQSLHAIEM